MLFIDYYKLGNSNAKIMLKNHPELKACHGNLIFYYYVIIVAYIIIKIIIIIISQRVYKKLTT